MATDYAVSDRTFELTPTSSWGGHLVFATASMDGFKGDIPTTGPGYPQPVKRGPAWGCDSGLATPWGSPPMLVPACVPDASGSLGPNWVGYKGARAPHVPTIFDRLAGAGLTWKLYSGTGGPTSHGFDGWGWAICPTFAECLYSSQRSNVVPATNILTDAHGKLPSFSIVTPVFLNSQHNNVMMNAGDNWIGRIVSAIQSGPDWSSTAIFLTWDDCGCFYDHVNPLQYNTTWGIRVPLVIISPYAKAGYTDSTPTSFAGMLAYTEHTFGIRSLNAEDTTAYDYSKAFCYDPQKAGCVPAGLAPVRMTQQSVPPFTHAQQAELAHSSDEDT